LLLAKIGDEAWLGESLLMDYRGKMLENKDRSKPNIVWIMANDMGYGDLTYAFALCSLHPDPIGSLN
jgi:hypothetical protein